MSIAVIAGAAYFALVFAVGFIIGVARVLAVAPVVGEVRAVLIELPVMLGASWYGCAVTTRRFRVAARVVPRLAMGAVALTLLLAAEAGLSVIGFGRTLSEHFATYSSAPAALGLLAQLLFASFPVCRLVAARAP